MDNGLHLLLGDEQLFVERALSAVLRRAREHSEAQAYGFDDGSGPAVSRLKAGEATPALLAELTSASLFDEHRVLILEEAQQAGAEPCEHILKLARGREASVTLVVGHSGAARNRALVNSLRELGAQVHDCPKLTRAGDRLDFVRAEFRELGVRVPPAVVQTLLDAVGSDLRELAQACSQLVADTGGVVNAEAVRRYYQGKAEVSGFDIADLALSGETAGALAAARWALASGVAPVLIADALAESALALARVGAAGAPPAGASDLPPRPTGRGTATPSPEALASSLGMPPWRVKKTQAQWRVWNAGASGRVNSLTGRSKAEPNAREPVRATVFDRVNSALRVVALLNADVKGAAVDVEFAVEKAVRRITELARAGSS